MTMRIAFGLYPGLTMLDFVGPYQVFTAVPDAEVVLCAAQRGRGHRTRHVGRTRQ
jgi:putative intracellular protease/amidase